MEPPALAWLGLGQSCHSQVFISLELELLLREETVTFITPHTTFLMSCVLSEEIWALVSCHNSEKQGRIELCRKVYFSNNEQILLYQVLMNR